MVEKISKPPVLASRLEAGADQFQFNWQLGNQILFRLLVLALLGHFAVYLFAAYKNMPFPYEFKGWCGDHLVYTSWLLSRGHNFYVDPAKEVSAAYTYTPLFQFLEAPLVKVFGPEMWTGRVVAMAGLGLIWILAFLAAARLTGSKIYGLLAVGLLMATYGAMDSHYDDIHPDSWCAALGLLSLFLAEGSLRKRYLLFPAALAGCLCYFAKQPGLSFVLGATVFLLFHRPRYALAYATMLLGLLALGYLAGQELTGGMFWRYTVVAPPKVPIIWYMVPATGYILASRLALGIIFFLLLALNRPRALAPASPYALALPFVFFLYGAASVRWGGNILSNFFPAIVLGAILVATALKELRTKLAQAEPKIAFFLLFLLLFQNAALFANTPRWPKKIHYQTATAIGDLVRETPGEVLVFYRIAFAYLNGKQVYDNWDEIVELYEWMDLTRLESQLQRQDFSLILIPQVYFDYQAKYVPSPVDHLEGKYELEKTISYPPWFQTIPLRVYRPKPSP